MFSFLGGALPGVAEQRAIKKKVAGDTARVSMLPNSEARDEALSISKKIVGTRDTAEAARDLTVGLGRSLLRVPETVGRSYVQARTGIDKDSSAPTDPLRRFLYGSEPIETYQTRRKGYKESLEKSRFRDVATPLSFLGIIGTAGLDVVPSPSKVVKALKPSVLKKIAEDTSVEGIKRSLKNELPDDVIERVAPAIAQTKDPKIVDNIIRRATEPKVSELGGVRPNNQIQTAIEQAHNAGDDATAARLIAQLPPADQPAMVSALGVASPPSLVDATIPNPNGGQRGFLKTIRESDTSRPELKEAAKAVEPQTYTQKSNPTLLKKAQETVTKDPDAALERIRTVERVSDEDVAIGQELVRRAQNEGRYSDAIEIVDKLDEQLRESGRAVQAASLWGRLTPEGVLKLAQRRIRKAREKIRGGVIKKGVEEEQKTARGIKAVVEGFSETDAPIVRNTVAKTIHQIANSQQALPLDGVVTRSGAVENTGQKLAKNIESAATPQIKKKADLLVTELTKKVKQEYLDPSKATKKSPTDILREVFGRTNEADEAYMLAQQILRDKYRNVPTMQKALDRFFASKLDMPAASSTVDSAIREQLTKNSTRISEVIYKSWANQKQSVDDITNALVKEGFDERSAKILATEVTSRLNTQLSAAKKTTLERLAADISKKERPTYLDKINKLSNLGALDDADYLQLARAKLKLPDLTPQLAKELSELAQKMQALPDGAEKTAIARQIQERIRAAIPLTTGEKIAQVIGVPRALQSSFDLSMGGRQGLLVAARHPVLWARANKESIKYLRSTKYFDEKIAELRKTPEYAMGEKYGLATPAANGGAEEAYSAAQLAEKIPGVGKGIEASQRAYDGGLTKLRSDLWAQTLKSYGGVELAEKNLGERGMRDLAEAINTLTGRGGKKGGLIEKHVQTLSTTLFAPRLWAARLNTLNPYYYARLSPAARKVALENAGAFAAVASVVLGAAAALGAEIETDARSSDFLKIKFGDTRYDPFGGLQQNMVFAWRQLTGEKKSSQTGDVTELGEGIFSPTRLSVASDLVTNKLAPVPATAVRLLEGKDRGGNDINPAAELAKLFVPINLQGIYETSKSTGSAVEGVAKNIPNFFGIGTQTYGVQDISLSDKQKAQVKLLEQQGAPKQQVAATKSFYQHLKSTPDRNQASKKVNEALVTGDTDKAVQIAKEYNQEYASRFKTWTEQYGDYVEDEALLEEYNAGKIKMTGENIRRRLKEIKENPLYQVEE